MSKMNPKYKSSWVTALRSGKFKQTTVSLRRGNSYCCLGVLCQIAGVPARKLGERGTHSFDGGSSVLTQRLRGVFELTDTNIDNLIDMNDSYGKSFEEIADYIEENL